MCLSMSKQTELLFIGRIYRAFNNILEYWKSCQNHRCYTKPFTNEILLNHFERVEALFISGALEQDYIQESSIIIILKLIIWAGQK